MTTMNNMPMLAVTQSSADVALEPLEVAAVVQALAAGAPFVGLLIDGVDRRAAALEAVLDQVADPATKLAWVGNPLRSPLTIERLFLQASGPEADLRVERDPAQLAHLLARPIGDESRKLIVVQQPETMDAETRELLSAIAPHLRSAGVPIQLLFVSGTSFRVPAWAAQIHLSETAVSPRRRLPALPIMLLLALALIGVLASTSPLVHRDLLDVAHRVLGTTIPTPAEPASAAAVPAAEARETVPATDVAALRGEFDQFLAQRATTLPPLTPAQKDELFQEFLTRHRQRAP